MQTTSVLFYCRHLSLVIVICSPLLPGTCVNCWWQETR